MCDTIVATPDVTAEHHVLFGKNSDRQRNEAQTVEFFPRAQFLAGTSLHCQYIAVPQVRRTRAVLLCRPFWIWGAEMGANERGVVIGNEAVHARTPAQEEPALTGNDLLRLALERADTAAEAVDIIIALLEEHGQGGNCGHLTPNYYNNAFMVADRIEAFVLETLGREWLLERVSGVRTISNRYSIGEEAIRTSQGLADILRDCGWSDGSSRNYAELIADPHREHIGFASARRERAAAHLRSRAGALCVTDVMAALRDHGPAFQPDSARHPSEFPTCTVCMHAGADERPGQTAGAMISELGSAFALHWVTGTAAPCLSIFKPVFLDVPLPAHGPLPTDRFDSRTLWWRHERLHRRALMGDFAAFLREITSERDVLELDFQNRVRSVLAGGSVDDRAQIIADCWSEAMKTEDRWYAHLKASIPPQSEEYAATWSRMNRIAGWDSALA